MIYKKFAELKQIEATQDALMLLHALNDFECNVLSDFIAARISHTKQVDVYRLENLDETIYVLRVDGDCPTVEYNEDQFFATDETVERVAIYATLNEALSDFLEMCKKVYE